MTGRVACVIGWPVAHSRSPLIHRFWLQRHGIDGDYRREAVPPDAVAEFVGSLAARGYVGGNVTLPHKEAAFALCPEVTRVAERLGAVNTLWLRDGQLCGDNTDAYGFAANLDEQCPAWREARSALVLGAGGSARAVLQALLDARVGTVAVANRTVSRAILLAERFGAPVEAFPFASVPELLRDVDLIVNTTSADLTGGGGLAIDWSLARPEAIATDISYVPLRTPFLAAAADRGLRTADGLGMLLHQAAPGFERWFGLRPVVDEELRALVVADLAD